jgi:uncharacterized protein YqjF (DUF2071 family)
MDDERFRRGPWVHAQTWIGTAFLHWPLPVEQVRRVVPPGLPVDTWEGRAWVTLTPLLVRDARPRAGPPPGALGTFPELNLRTYTTLDGLPGVVFLTLDCASLLAVITARALYRLPYRLARMAMRREGDRVRFASRRVAGGPRPAEVAVAYAPAGEARPAAAGTLDHWLLERYCAYAAGRLLGVLRADIAHPPWRVRPAAVEVPRDTLSGAHGLARRDPPLAHVAERQDVNFWLPRRVRPAPPRGAGAGSASARR